MLKNIECGYSLDCFVQELKNIRFFLFENFPFLVCKIFNIFEWACFRNVLFRGMDTCPSEIMI